MTLLERLEWILANRKMSARQLALQSGLSSTHVSTMMGRLRKHPDVSVELETLEKIARGGQVPLEWMISGKGKPDEPRTPAPPPSSQERPAAVPQPAPVEIEAPYYPPEHVEEWFSEASQRLGRAVSGRILLAAKRIAATAPTKVSAAFEDDRAGWAVLIIETAEEMDALGMPLEPNAMFHFMLTKLHARLPQRDRGDAERLEATHASLRAKGIEPPAPGEVRRGWGKGKGKQ